MENSTYFTDVLVFLAAMLVIVPLFQRLKLSPILGYLAAGMIIGPYGFELIGDTKAAKTLAHFGVVFLLFMVGLELSFGRLKSLGSKVFGLGTSQLLLSGFLIAFVAYLFGFSIYSAAIIGAGLALSSTAFVLKLLEERGERASVFGLNTFSILLLQDLAVVPILIFVTLVGSPDGSLLDSLKMAALKGGAALLLVIIIGRFLLRPAFRWVASIRSTELFVSATLLAILGSAWIMQMSGLSMELGALLAGLLLAETEYKHQIESDIKPFRGILLGLFFMTIGMFIDIGLIVDNWYLIAVIVGCLMLGKALIITILCRVFSIPINISLRTGLALSQAGEFGFVIFGAAAMLGMLQQNITQILMAVIALSMTATPAMFYFGKKISDLLNRNNITDEKNIDIGDIKRHVLIAGFGRVGQTIAKMLSDAGFAWVALDLDHDRVANCRAKGLNVYFADARQINVLKAAGAGQARAAIITIDNAKSANLIVSALRNIYSDLPIFVRARDRKHMQNLQEYGATEVVSEAAEASLQLGGIVLKYLNVGIDEIAGLMEEYREDNYTALKEIIGDKKGD